MAQGQDVNEFKQLTFVWESNGQTNVDVYTDLPGGALVYRQTVALASSGGARKEQTFALDLSGALRGRLISLRASMPNSGTYCILLEGRVHVKKIGVYLDSTSADRWEMPGQSLGG